MVSGWLKSGGNASSPEQVTGKEAIPTANSPKVVDRDSETIHTSQESTVDGDLLSSGSGESEDAPSEDSSEGDTEQASSEAAPTKTSGTKEVITVTDDKGRRKIEIDYSDKDQVKKFVQMAYGARKWQAERDQARQETAKERAEKAELRSNWDTLENAFQKNGHAGVIDLLEGRQGAYKDYIKKEIDREHFLRTASPAEIEALEAKEARLQDNKELSRIRKENEDFRKQMQAEKENADLAALESRVNPTFDKHRFAGKLGDENDEEMFDEMLWNTAMKRLEPYEAKGLPITAELADREFRAVAQSLRKRIGVQAERKASQVVEQKKQEATENVQAKVKSGYRSNSNSTAKEANDLINSNNLTGLLSGWGKYGKLFNGSK
jgi:hypothetical protein